MGLRGVCMFAPPCVLIDLIMRTAVYALLVATLILALSFARGALGTLVAMRVCTSFAGMP